MYFSTSRCIHQVLLNRIFNNHREDEKGDDKSRNGYGEVEGHEIKIALKNRGLERIEKSNVKLLCIALYSEILFE